MIARALLAFAVVTTLSAGELDQATRKILLDHLNQSSAEFVDSVKGLSSEQWNYKPASGGWSVAECAQHIALSEEFLREMVEKNVLSAKASPERIAERKMLDGKILPMITNRTVKATAPEPLQPIRPFPTPEAAIQEFQESRRKTIELAANREDLREHAVPHFVFKELDGYQWLLYLSGHTMRHTAQIREVKSDAGFPKGK
jgi:hypothetical protein